MTRILIVTPLYPPDIAGPAPYVKELATRIKDTHEVTVLAYNHIPEHIEDVRFVTVEKNRPTLIRLFHYTYALFREVLKTDYVYIQNGPSTELPFVLISFFVRTPCILRLGDEVALSHSVRVPVYKALLLLALARSHSVIIHSETSTPTRVLQKALSKKKHVHDISRPHTRPEILPFVPYPTQQFMDYETSWESHLKDLFTIHTS